MRTLLFDLLLAASLTLLVICGVQTYHRFFAVDPLEVMMDKYGSPSAGDPASIQAEWDDLIKRAKVANKIEVPK